MAFTDKFKTQHDEILALAAGISEMLKAREPDVAGVRRQLSLLAGKVKFHLAMEDEALYPRLIERKGTPAAAVAGKFMKEMGGLADAFSTYTAKWQVSTIRSDLPGFADETRKVLGALGHRIARETSELYPLADRAA